jgi:hypothetical protein
MPTEKLPRQETRAPYTRNAPRRQDNILQAASNKLGSWGDSCFRVDTEASNGDCRHSRDTRQSRKLLARVRAPFAAQIVTGPFHLARFPPAPFLGRTPWFCRLVLPQAAAASKYDRSPYSRNRNYPVTEKA